MFMFHIHVLYMYMSDLNMSGLVIVLPITTYMNTVHVSEHHILFAATSLKCFSGLEP